MRALALAVIIATAAVSWWTVPARPNSPGPAVRSRPVSHLPGAVERLHPGGAGHHPSPYWVAERKLVVALHVQGRLGATIRRLRAENRRLKAQLARKRRTAASASAPAHLSMWLCIHRNEQTPWHYHGYYDGGLQMGDWFEQTYAGGRDVAYLSALDQMWIAERAYQREGYSLSWLYGQWPNTHRGCA